MNKFEHIWAWVPCMVREACISRGGSVWWEEGIRVGGPQVNKSEQVQSHMWTSCGQTHRLKTLPSLNFVGGRQQQTENLVQGVLDCNRYYVEISCNKLCGKLQYCQHIAGYLFYEVICGGVASFAIWMLPVVNIYWIKCTFQSRRKHLTSLIWDLKHLEL